MNNQYAIGRGFDWLKTVFRDNINGIGHTVLAYPYGAERRILPVDRIWCVWEMYCSTAPLASAFASSSASVPASVSASVLAAAQPPATAFELCIPSSARKRFEHDLVHSFDRMQDELSKIDLSTATAFKRSDIVAIMEVINSEEGGVDRVTKETVKAIKRWMICAGGAARQRMAAGNERAASALQLNLARLMREVGDLGPADTTVRDGEALAREAVEARAHMHGAGAPETLEAKLLLANLVKDQGGLREAEALMREALAGRRSAFGPGHPLTLTIVGELGRLMQDEERFAEAEPLLREAHERYSEFFAFSLGHRVATGALGLLLSLLNRFAEAEPLLRDALRMSAEAEGSQSYGALLMARNLADLLISRTAATTAAGEAMGAAASPTAAPRQ